LIRKNGVLLKRQSEMAKGFFVMIDGPDGVGKGTLTNAVIKHLVEQGKEVLELQRWWLKHGWHPPIGELKSRKINVLISAEPTFVGVGKEIRNEIISTEARKAGRKYSARQTAEAYALDRTVLYQNVIIPALKAGITVIQERGFPSSLAYQTLQAKESGESLTMEHIAQMEGNQLAMQFPPDLLVIPTVNAEEAIKRLEKRFEKKDDAIFEKKNFQEKLRALYNTVEFIAVFEKLGTKVVFVDASKPISETEAQIIDILNQYIKSSKPTLSKWFK